MKRALMLIGVFVVGIDIDPCVDAGDRTEHTTCVADYDSYEGRIGDLVEAAIHSVGFRRSDCDLIGFDADCKTRSQMTMNMNGKCRDGTTGSVDLSKPGGAEAARRDRIDRQATQWIDSILESHSDAECITHATAWPHGPGGWGFSDEDAHTILISPPRWDPSNSTVDSTQRERARAAYRRAATDHATHPPPSTAAPLCATIVPAPSHPGTNSP